MRRKPPEDATLSLVRCAIYTRKSTEEGLDQDFNSLDAQRESAEAFIESQKHEGWTCLPDRYDDGGFTGANVERPGLRRLLEDVEAGKVDCVVCYKVDRLSRSLLDFAGLLQTFEQHGVSFVAVTQRIDTSTSMGRLILNVLLSFAQFEREIISERTRDKIAATRRKGKWSGGRPVLGYDLDRERRRLVVNEEEAERVRAIFALYLEHEALLPVVRELEKREWAGKRWVNLAGAESGGELFTKTSLHRLLTNVVYLGKVRYREEIHEGEHPAIVDPAVWQNVQTVLQRNARLGGAPLGKHGAILKGLLRCASCDCSMSPSCTTKKKTKQYRYYVCSNAQKRGWDKCPSKSVPAHEIEKFVIDQIRGIGEDPALLEETLSQARQQDQEQVTSLETEQRKLGRDLLSWQKEIHQLSGQLGGDGSDVVIARLADLQERIRLVENRVRRIRDQIHRMRHQMLDEDEAVNVMRVFDPLWESLIPGEQAEILHLLIEQVNYDGEQGKISITFHPTGIRALTEELSRHQQEQSA